MTNGNSAVALRSPVAARDATEDGYMGDLVAWRFARGGDHAFKAPRDKVKAIFQAAGFGGLLDDKLSDSKLALSDAARQAHVGRGFIVQEFAKKNDDTPYAVGVYYREGKGEAGDDMICCARVRIVTRAGVELAEVFEPEGGVPSFADADKAKRCQLIAAEVMKSANLRMTHTLANELSEAIVAAGRSCMWAAFRKAGGVYWVHSKHAGAVRNLLDSLETLGGFWTTLQPLFGDGEGRTLKNISAAATETIVAEIDDLVADLKKAQADGMKEKSVEARRIRCQQLVIQADLYRAVLEKSHASIVGRINTLHTDFGKLLDTSETDNAFSTEGI